MSTVEKRTVSLPADLARYIDELVTARRLRLGQLSGPGGLRALRERTPRSSAGRTTGRPGLRRHAGRPRPVAFGRSGWRRPAGAGRGPPEGRPAWFVASSSLRKPSPTCAASTTSSSTPRCRPAPSTMSRARDGIASASPTSRAGHAARRIRPGLRTLGYLGGGGQHVQALSAGDHGSPFRMWRRIAAAGSGAEFQTARRLASRSPASP